jgi:CBS domain-containing protein
MNTNVPLKQIMTYYTVTIDPDTIMTEIADLFESNTFHHIPVVNEEGIPVGIISSDDYRQLQHHFTHINKVKSEVYNRKLFRSLLASDVMTKKPICLTSNNTISDAIEIFLKNKVRSIIIVENGKYVGIVTPLDILKEIHRTELVKSK